MPPSSRIAISEYDPRWPETYRSEEARILSALGGIALGVEHTGSTSVPGLAAKPVIDMILVVKDSADEGSWLPALEGAGYELRIREPGWFEHRLLKRTEPAVNLHVFSEGCIEIGRVLRFRDWLRAHPEDRELYANTKIALAEREWPTVDYYAQAKTGVIREILARAGA